MMKKLLFSLVICVLLFSSCDDSSTNTNNTQSIVGNYVLTSLVSDVSVDLDQDGNTDTELTNETTCFDTMAISFDANGNFTTTISEVGFDTNNNLTCSTSVESGTYTYNNGVLTITVQISGGSATESQQVLLTPTTLEFNVTDADVANYFSGAPGTPAAGITQLDVVYTRI